MFECDGCSIKLCGKYIDMMLDCVLCLPPCLVHMFRSLSMMPTSLDVAFLRHSGDKCFNSLCFAEHPLLCVMCVCKC